MLESTEGTIQRNIGYKRRRQTKNKNTTQYVFDTHHYTQTNTDMIPPKNNWKS